MTSTPRTARVSGLINFLNASPTPFHAVQNARIALESSGFKSLPETESWANRVAVGGRYYVTRNGTSILAFVIGPDWVPGRPVAMVGAHTDSPCLRVKPVSNARNSEGFIQVGVETYGGGLWHTWFDRDLSLAGRVLVNAKGPDGSKKISGKIINLERPILRVPTVAIHLLKSDSFKFNEEDQLLPVAGLKEYRSKPDEEDSLENPFKIRHNQKLLSLIADKAGVAPTDILDFEMILYDTQPACLGGMDEEFVFSARLDNLLMSYCAIEGLRALVDQKSSEVIPGASTTIQLVALFDNEEVGSLTTQGANSNFLSSVLARLDGVFGHASKISGPDEGSDTLHQTLSRSLLLSADMSHAAHPNYAKFHEAAHRPRINGGPVIKVSAKARYATSGQGIALVQAIAQEAGIPLQYIVGRNDAPTGSTIGPMLAAKLGIRAVDLGNPQLSMHSIREMGGVLDVDLAIELFLAFWNRFDREGVKLPEETELA